MNPIPQALRRYPDTYHVALNKEQLNALATRSVTTHTSIHAERLHRASEAIMLPGRWKIQLFARIIEPLPGKDKDHRLWGVAVRTISAVLWVLSLPLAIVSYLVAMALRSIDHGYRPIMSYIDASKEPGAKSKQLSDLKLTQQEPLKIRTLNVGFVTAGMSKLGDLLPPDERAEWHVEAIKKDELKPDMIFFNETFGEDPTRILCEGIKEEYPYIIYHVAPQISGFNSGAMVASKYPFESVEFHTLDGMLTPENMAPKGLIKVKLQTEQGPLIINGVHPQALLGEARAQARYFQFGQIHQIMEKDLAAQKDAMQVVCGDFNTSRINAWGGDNMNPRNQSETRTFERFNQLFDDIFLRDHDSFTGKRLDGAPKCKYLEHDCQKSKVNFEEPTASWVDGPFYDPGCVLARKMAIDRKKYNREPSVQVVPRKENISYGTFDWRSKQIAENARFDMIAFLKGQTLLDGRCSIRRLFVPEGAQSGLSDHLPVDGEIWRR